MLSTTTQRVRIRQSSAYRSGEQAWPTWAGLRPSNQYRHIPLSKFWIYPFRKKIQSRKILRCNQYLNCSNECSHEIAENMQQMSVL